MAHLILEHDWQMKARVAKARPIRRMDLLFREIFNNHEHIHRKIAGSPVVSA